MKHDLRQQNRLLLVESEIFEQKCKFLDELSPEVLAAMQTGKQRTNIFGDVIPTPFMQGACCVIPVQGILMAGCPEIYKAYGFCDPRDVVTSIKDAQDDKSIEKVMLWPNSPGGTVTGSIEFGNAVAGFQKANKKPLGVFSDGSACSAMYWGIAGGTMLLGTPTSRWGNVGIYTSFVNQKKSLEAMGYTIEVFKSGPYKAIGENGDLTDEQRDYIQAGIDDLYELFVTHVQAFRDISPEDLQGQSFMGQVAADKGFIDGVVSDLDEAISLLK